MHTPARTGHRNAGRFVKAVTIAVLFVIAFASWAGLPLFGTSLWIAYGVMAAIEIAMAVALVVSQWRNRPAAIVVAILAVFQAGQSFYNEQVRYDRGEPVIPIDNLGVIVLCMLAIALIAAGASWPVSQQVKA